MQYRNGLMQELKVQLRYSPEPVRRDEARRIEDLIPEIVPGCDYPYEYVCYRITQFRPANHMDAVIPGKALAEDLRTLLLDISSGVVAPVEAEKAPPLSLEDMAKCYGVSARTVGRWRATGLVMRYFRFPDGKSRLAARPSALKRFEERHPECLRKAEKYRPVSDDEERRVLARARMLHTAGVIKLTAVARRIASETGRSIETIRRLIRNADTASGGGRLFPAPGRKLSHEECLDLAARFRAGVPVKDLSRRFQCSEATIYRALHRALVEQALAEPVKFVPNPEFDESGAAEDILGPSGLFIIPPGPVKSPTKPPPQLPGYLRELYRIPLLTREQERDLFRKYNYVKSRMAKFQDEIRAKGYRTRLLEDFEAHRVAAEALRKILVRSNLRLVVSIAKRHVGRVVGLFELISEGNLCLIRAVKCFDYGRGTRFSTYATWALTKHFARVVPVTNYRLSTFVTGQDELIESLGDHRMDVAEYSEKLAHLKSVIAGAVENLVPRERAIIEARFGTAGDKPHTLQELAAHFGLTRERIRQIEARALLKLRHHLGPDAAETAGI